ncbi:hypothetical protein QA291_01230 [Glaesserella parasuis]|uniref:hypothetical protein n=1 Tax=Glaesserella parasuis TaxID=738 RepID=UPI00243738BA|nr:hypothetical protein [Glaesserella parasuis]MDG6871706.1 hypothetical protein [Glaesserella parasuis]
MVIIIFLGMKNGGYIYNAVGKSLRIFIILFLFFISYKDGFISFYDIRKNIRAFYLTTFISIPILYYAGYYNDQGIILERVSGFLYDPNYLSLFCFIFILYLSYFGKLLNIKNKKDILCLLFIILLCQSWSIFLFIFIYYTIGYKRLCYLGKLINPYFPIFIIFFIWCVLYSLDKIAVYQDWSESHLFLKLNSLIFRLNAMLDGFSVINTNSDILLYGMGSGRSLEITDRVFHNLYFQQLFDHGIIYYLVFSLLLWYLCKHKFFDKVEMIHVVIFFLTLNNIIFDNFYSFIFPFSIFIFLSTKENSNTLLNSMRIV